MASFWRDVRYGWRMLAKAPGHTAAAAVALGLGIGLTTAVFSIVYGLMWRGLPFPRADRLMSVDTENAARNLVDQPAGLHDYLDWRRRQTSFEGLAAIDEDTVTVSGDDRPERLAGARLTADALDLLRVRPLLGRGFLPGEDRPGAAPVVLLSYRLWQDHYRGDRRILGRAVRVDGRPATVVGIMPPSFRFPHTEKLWTPLPLDPGKSERGKDEQLLVVGRLRPGVTAARADAEMAAIAHALAAELPRTNRGLGAHVQPLVDRFVGRPLRLTFTAMLGAVCSVLLIACINVASLIMSRAIQRTREMAIRTALGAGRGRVIGQILTESLILALLGAAAGLGLAWEGVALFNAAIVDMDPAAWIRIAIDPPALLFALAATLAAAAVSGLVPAFEVSRTRPGEVLKDEGRATTGLRLGRLSRMVVVAELALSCALLVPAGLMVKRIVLGRTLPLGFQAGHLLTWRVPLSPASYPRPAERAAFYRRLLERLRDRPEVQAAGGTTSLPSTAAETAAFAVEGRAYPTDADYPVAHSDAVSAGLFAALGVKPLAGREFEPHDTLGSQPVAIVNQSLARRLWPGRSALGQRLRLARSQDDGSWRTVVGVVPDVYLYGAEGDKQPAGCFRPVSQVGPDRLSFVVRTPLPPLSLTAMVRREVAALDRDAPIYFVKTMQQAVADDLFYPDLSGSLFAVFGLSALVLAAVGIYGVVAFSVERRTQEIGLRMALGARRRDVLGMLVRQGALQLALGLGFGLPAALGAALLLADVIFPVRAGDPAVFTVVAAGLAAVALLACLLPGQRAMDVEPSVALRYDA